MRALLILFFVLLLTAPVGAGEHEDYEEDYVVAITFSHCCRIYQVASLISISTSTNALAINYSLP